MSQDGTEKLIRDIAFNGIRVAVPFAVSIATYAVIARTLGPEKMGLYSYAIWLASFLTGLATLGFPLTLTKYAAEHLGRGNRELAAALVRRLLLVDILQATVLSAVVFVACYWFPVPIERTAIAVVCVMVIPRAVCTAGSGAITGTQRYDRLALIYSSGAFFDLVLVVIAAALGAGVVGMLVAILIGFSLRSWALVMSSRQFLIPGQSHYLLDSNVGFKSLRGFLITTSLIAAFDLVTWQQSEVFFLQRYSVVAEIAIYGIAFSLAAKAGQIGNMVGGVFLPRFAEAYGRSGFQELGDLFQQSLKHIQIVMVPLCMAGLIIARPAVRLVFGTGYTGVAPVLQILFASLLVTSMGAVSSAVCYSTEHQNFIVGIAPFIAVMNIGGDLLFIPRGGAIGAAIANSVAQTAAVLIGLAYSARLLRSSFPWYHTNRIYAAAAIAFAPTAYAEWRSTREVVLCSMLLLSGILYAVLLIRFGQIRPAAIRMLVPKWR